MHRLACLAVCAVVLTACEKPEFTCVEKAVELKPQPHEIGDTRAFRLLYLGEKGLTVTTDPGQVPWYVQHAVWVELGDDRPTGVATVVDLGQPDSKIRLLKREDAIIQAHAGAIGHWAGNLALERSQLMAESSPESEAYKIAAAEAGDADDILGSESVSLFTMDRRRRLRTAIWAQPRLSDFIKEPAPKRWFATPQCETSGDMPDGYQMTNIDQEPNKKLWQYLVRWTGSEPAIPATF